MITTQAAELDPFAPDFGNATELFSELPGGRPAPAVLHRWIVRGVAGHRLGAIKFRGAWHTSKTEIRRWLAAVSAESLDVVPTDGVDHEAVERELKARGYC